MQELLDTFVPFRFQWAAASNSLYIQPLVGEPCFEIMRMTLQPENHCKPNLILLVTWMDSLILLALKKT